MGEDILPLFPYLPVAGDPAPVAGEPFAHIPALPDPCQEELFAGQPDPPSGPDGGEAPRAPSWSASRSRAARGPGRAAQTDLFHTPPPPPPAPRTWFGDQLSLLGD